LTIDGEGRASGIPSSQRTEVRMKRRLSWTTRAGAASVIAALAVAIPVSAANAQTPAVSPLWGLPAAALLPPAQAAAASAALSNLPAVFPAVPVPLAGRVAVGGYAIGDVLNGGTAVMITNGSPVNSANVIGSP
jgi:hypothetical protein